MLISMELCLQVLSLRGGAGLERIFITNRYFKLWYNFNRRLVYNVNKSLTLFISNLFKVMLLYLFDFTTPHYRTTEVYEYVGN